MIARTTTAGAWILALLLAGPSAATCPTTSHIATDQDLNAALDGLAFVAEGRIGDLGGAATFELDLGHDTGAPEQTEQYSWSSGVVEPFTLSYDSGTNTVTYSLGGKTLQYQPSVGFKEMFIRCRAVNANTTVTVDNLVLNGCPVGDSASASGNGSGLDILALTGVELDQGFTLTGDATLTWQGAPPTQSRLAFQIKVGNEQTVSVDATSWSQLKQHFRD